MAYVLTMEKSTMGGHDTVYTLTKDGKETKNKSEKNIDINNFWASMGPTLDAIVGLLIS